MHESLCMNIIIDMNTWNMNVFGQKRGKEAKSATGKQRLNMRQSKERHCVNRQCISGLGEEFISMKDS